MSQIMTMSEQNKEHNSTEHLQTRHMKRCSKKYATTK